MNSIAQALASANISTGYHTYFDPIDAVENSMARAPAICAKILNSAAWTIDMACINSARNVLFTGFKEQSDDATFQEFCEEMDVFLDQSNNYEEDTPAGQLSLLLGVRKTWHDAAQAAAAADNRDYNPSSLDTLMHSEKPRVADISTRNNLRKIAKLESKGDEAVEQRFLAAFIEADTLAAIQRVEDNKRLMPALSLILQSTERYAKNDARFDQLAERTQRSLTESIVRSFDRTKIEAAKTMSRQPIAFGHALEAMYQCTGVLNKVLAAKFSTASELENNAH